MTVPTVTLTDGYWVAACPCGWVAARVYRAAADGAAIVHAQECPKEER